MASDEDGVLAEDVGQLTLRCKDHPAEKIGKHKNILEWLSPIDSKVNYERARSLSQHGTGEWLLHDLRFKVWLTGETRLLWLHGIPGSGKTVLSSSVIAELKYRQKGSSEVPPAGIAFHYLDFKDSRSLDPSIIFGALVKELCLELPSSDLHPSIQSLYDLNYNKTTGEAEEPSWQDLIELIIDLAASFPRVYIVLDALDEGSYDVQENVLYPALKKLAEQPGPNITLLVTSRKEGIMQEFLEIDLGPRLVSKDIALYVRAEIERRQMLANTSTRLREHIVESIVKGAHGMFRWANCQLMTLSQLQGPEQILQALNTLPRGLVETYDRILEKIDKDDAEKARRSLTWLTMSARPLSPAELTEAISIDPGETNPKRNKAHLTLGKLLRVCGGLMIEIKSGGKSTVGLAHASVKEYLQSPTHHPNISVYKIDQQKAHQELAYTCLTYLAFDAFKVGHAGEYAEFQKRMVDFPLLLYAAKYSSIHFRYGQLDPAGRVLQVLFPLKNRKDRINNHLRSWRQARDGFGYHEPFVVATDIEATPLFFASESGLTSVVKHLLSFRVDVNTNCFYGTALQAASAEGYLDIVEDLLNYGADLDASSEELGTALQAACGGGHVSTAKFLVTKGANVNQISGFGGTALAAAAYRGKSEIVSLLLHTGSNINLFAGRYGTALLAASYRGRTSVVKLLLDSGADVNIQGTRYGNALKAASEEGHLKIVQMLLDHGADIHIIGAEYGTALQSASRAGSEPVTRLLLEAGAAVDAVGGYYGTALQAAARTSFGVTRVLLDAGANINLESGHYGNALAAAIYFGRTEIVGLLLDSGAVANIASVQAAILEGHESTAKLLEQRLKQSERAQLTN